MRHFFNSPRLSTLHQQVLLEDNELLKLRAFAEQLDCSASPEQVLSSKRSGNLPTKALGSGSDYAESRIYQPGDDPRTINWRLSARSQETFVKTFHIESRPTLNILLDKRRPMIFGTKRQLKVTQAARASILLAYAAAHHHLSFQAWVLCDDRQTPLFFDDIHEFVAEANKPVQINTEISEDLDHQLFNQILQTLYSQTVKGALIYLISDFHELDQSHIADLAQLNEYAFVQALHITDKAEHAMPSVGRIQLQAMFHDQACSLDTKKKKDQATFLNVAQQHFESITSIFKNTGLSHHLISTDQDDIHSRLSLPLGLA